MRAFEAVRRFVGPYSYQTPFSKLPVLPMYSCLWIFQTSQMHHRGSHCTNAFPWPIFRTNLCARVRFSALYWPFLAMLLGKLPCQLQPISGGQMEHRYNSFSARAGTIQSLGMALHCRSGSNNVPTLYVCPQSTLSVGHL